MAVATQKTVLSEIDKLLKMIGGSHIGREQKEYISFILLKEKQKAWEDSLPVQQISEEEGKAIENAQRDIQKGKGFSGNTKEVMDWLSQ